MKNLLNKVVNSKKQGFTLAEVMVTLVVIGIIASIIIPIAIKSKPDEGILKFKQGHNLLFGVIQQLVNSDQYYLNGDLGIKPDGTLINGDNDGDYTYFCRTVADLLATKSVNCGEKGSANTIYANGLSCSDWENQESKLDTACLDEASNIGEEIVTVSGIVFYQTYTSTPFGWDNYSYWPRLFTQNVTSCSGKGTCDDEAPSAYRCKRVFCMDVDGIGTGEDPFGYGIRADGKIVVGARAQEWLEKDLQGED